MANGDVGPESNAIVRQRRVDKITKVANTHVPLELPHKSSLRVERLSASPTSTVVATLTLNDVTGFDATQVKSPVAGRAVREIAQHKQQRNSARVEVGEAGIGGLT